MTVLFALETDPFSVLYIGESRNNQYIENLHFVKFALKRIGVLNTTYKTAEVYNKIETQ